MSSWINDTAVQNHNGTGFPHIKDPSSVSGAIMDPSFLANTGQFNPQFPSPQMVGMQNGPIRNASPSFSNPMYQTNSVIPSKRPRPREDSIGQSPRQASGLLPTSRAETPQQSSFPRYPQSAIGQQPPNQPSPYSHLPTNGSANATPSPIMANAMRPNNVPQRVATTSPHPFSPATQHFSTNSPAPSEHGGTPQPSQFMQQNNFANFNSQFTPTQSPARPSPTPNPMPSQLIPPQQMGGLPQQIPHSQPGQMQGQLGQMNQVGPMGQGYNPQMQQGRNPAAEQQRMMYQMQLQQQAQRNNMQMQQMSGMPGPNMMGAPQNLAPVQPQMQARNMMAARQGMPNGQVPPGAFRPQQSAQLQPTAARSTQGAEQFMKQLAQLMASRQLPLDTNPIVENRPIFLPMLFQWVTKYGGYLGVTQSNAWAQIAQHCGFSPSPMSTAPQQVRLVYERNLLKFEEFYAAQQKSKMLQLGSAQVAGNITAQGSPIATMAPGQAQANHMMPMGPQQPIAPSPTQTPVQQMSSPQTGVNGSSSPSPGIGQAQANPAHGTTRSSTSQLTPTNEHFNMGLPTQGRTGNLSVPGSAHEDNSRVTMEQIIPEKTEQLAKDRGTYVPSVHEMQTFGGVNLEAIPKLAADLERWRPDIPPPFELGYIDIQALCRSIQSGIHGEVRMALDTLASVTAIDPAKTGTHLQNALALQIQLQFCDELVETLVECAEDQLALLVENADESAAEALITPYEDTVRSCRVERMVVQKVHVFSSPEYQLERAADRLICISTIMRNLSCIEENQPFLKEEVVVKFLCDVVQYLGTRENLMRSHRNTLDLMKDLVVLLSNICGYIEITGQERAEHLLDILLAFAPAPGPTLSNDRIFFPPYEPDLHPYLPHALYALAKLFARAEPNHVHYRKLFTEEADLTNTALPCERLTRTFGLAISVIPDQNRDIRAANLPTLVESRKALIMQGLLAANVLALLAPGQEMGVNVTGLWLTSGNGFAQNLFHLVCHLSAQFELQKITSQPNPRARGNQSLPPNLKDYDLVYIVSVAVRMLKCLKEKARSHLIHVGVEDVAGGPPTVLPNADSVLAQLSMISPEWNAEGMLRNLVDYASLDD